MNAYRYHILLALAHGEAHGAEIRRRVEDESAGELTLYPAMLYGTLDELSGLAWITEVEAAGRERARWRVYSLLPEGRRALAAETARLEGVIGRARAALEAAEGP